MGIIRWLKTSLSPQSRAHQRSHDRPRGNSPKSPPDDRGVRADETGPGKTVKQRQYATKRRYERFSVEGSDIRAKAVVTEVIELSNVSTGGACIVTTGTLSPGDNVLLKIPSEKVEKPLRCTIIWEAACDEQVAPEGANVHARRAGVRFENLAPGTVVRLKDFMRTAGVPREVERDETYKPGPLRYSILVNEKTFMNYAATFAVKQISLGGMLVEAGPGLQIGMKYPAALYLPGSDRRVRFTARVASKIPAAGGFDAGIEFCDMSEEDRGSLSEFLDGLASTH